MGTAESAQLPHPPTPLENTRPILPFFRSLEVLCYFFLHFNEAMHVFRVFSPPAFLFVSATDTGKISLTTMDPLDLVPIPFGQHSFFYLLCLHQTSASNPALFSYLLP